MASSVASNNQPSTEGQHGHGATQRHKISGVVRLEAEGLFERSDNQATAITLDRLLFRLWRLFTEGMFAYCSCNPPDEDCGPICSSVCSLINRISGLGCDTFQDPIKVLSAMSANSQDSKNGGFYLPRSRDCGSALPFAKTIVLIALPVVHGQSRGCL